MIATERIVDTDEKPVGFYRYVAKEHRGIGRVRFEKREDGELYIDGKKVELFVMDFEHRRPPEGKISLNATVLFYLMENREIIPESWKNKRILFQGTIFTTGWTDVHVATLNWYDSGNFYSWPVSPYAAPGNEETFIAVISE